MDLKKEEAHQALVQEALLRLRDAEGAVRKLADWKVIPIQAAVCLRAEGDISEPVELNHANQSSSEPEDGRLTSAQETASNGTEEASKSPDAVDAGRTPEPSVSSMSQTQTTVTNTSSVQVGDLYDVTLDSIIWVRCGACCLSCPILHPESRRRLVWLVFGMLFVYAEAVCIPYNLAFSVQPEGNFVRWIVNTYFLVDFVLCFFTGFTETNGNVVSSPTRVWKQYLRTWFLPDAIAAIPWMLKDLLPGDLSRLTRATRLARVMKSKGLLEILEKELEGNWLLMFSIGIGRVLAMLFLACHWCACIWFNSASHAEMSVNWIDTHMPEEVRELDRIENHTAFYTWSLYFTATTMLPIGYGHIAPTNTVEVQWVFVFLCLAALVFAFQLGSLDTLIANLNTHQKMKREERIRLARYLKWRSVPRKLHVSIWRYCNFLWETNQGNDVYEGELKHMLPPVLRRELCGHIYGGMLRSVPFLVWMCDHKKAVQHLASMIVFSVFERGDFLFQKNSAHHKMYVLLLGRIRVTRRGVQECMDAYHGSTVPQGRRRSSLFSSFSNLPAWVRHLGEKREAGTRRSAVSMSVNHGSGSHSESNSGSALTRDEIQFALSMEDEAISIPAHVDADFSVLVQLMASSKLSKSLWKSQRRRISNQDGGVMEKSAGTQWNQKSEVPSSKSLSVAAPAFFGESCLFRDTPSEDQNIKRFGYDAQCEALCETIAIDRETIDHLVQAYSPTLGVAFSKFQKLYVACRKEQTSQCVGPVDVRRNSSL